MRLRVLPVDAITGARRRQQVYADAADAAEAAEVAGDAVEGGGGGDAADVEGLSFVLVAL